MCGRFTLRTPAGEIARLFQLSKLPDLRPRYNVAPTQPVAAIRMSPERQERELVMLRWGLVPFWADDPKIGYRTINARAETVASKPAFRQAFSQRRCLIVADGFYEWRSSEGRKQPFLIRMKNGGPFAFAGLWERWQAGDGTELRTCTIIVTEANALVKPIHDRMPVILSPEDYALWLAPDSKHVGALQSLLAPYPPDAMETYAVSNLVNNPRNDLEQCIDPKDG